MKTLEEKPTDKTPNSLEEILRIALLLAPGVAV
jgi:hypothetical protein